MTEETISLEDIFRTIRRRLGLIITVSILVLALTALITFVVITPKYEATTQILVNNEQEESNTSQLQQSNQFDLQLINTYSVILRSPVILNDVIEDLGLDIKASGLSSKLSIGNEQNSKVMVLTVTDTDPKQAVDIANSITETFVDKIEGLMSIDNVNVLMTADIADSLSPVSPNVKINLAIGLVLGAMLGIALAFLLDFLDKTFRSEKEVEELLGLPVIGMISEMDMKKERKNIRNTRNTRKRGR
ncbi:YveK family protein [Ornithinibacillus sp. 4-3]|uniref:YveK family protein n=1 Tax=Ornithinibacillus sp. 4-3 TaxID=3231488 RepID=A0AB39HLB7_9BACI